MCACGWMWYDNGLNPTRFVNTCDCLDAIDIWHRKRSICYNELECKFYFENYLRCLLWNIGKFTWTSWPMIMYISYIMYIYFDIVTQVILKIQCWCLRCCSFPNSSTKKDLFFMCQVWVMCDLHMNIQMKWYKTQFISIRLAISILMLFTTS